MYAFMRLNSSFLSVKLSALFHSNCPTHTRTTDTAQLDSIDRVETIYSVLLSTEGNLRCCLVFPCVYILPQQNTKYKLECCTKKFCYGGGVLGILTNRPIQISRPWKQISTKRFFQNQLFTHPSTHPEVPFQYFQI